MDEKRIIIIGAGLAGLSAGCYAQMNGYHSQIFEHHTQPGGVAATWTRKGYLIDGGVHFWMGHQPGQPIYELYRELGAAQSNRFQPMTTYGRFLDEASGRSIDVTTDLDRLARELKAFSPSDVAIIDDLVAGARAMQAADLGEMGISKPPELMGALDRLRDVWSMRRVVKYFSGPYARSVAEYCQSVRDPWLRRFLEYLFLPEVPVWFVLMVLGMVASGQIAFLDGASNDVAQSIAARHKSLGGQVTYKATVEEILVEDGRAVGVRLADGNEHRADVVVSAADGYSTIFKMLGGRYVDEKILARYRTWKPISPMVMVNFGVTREFPDDPVFTMVMLERPLTVGGETVRALFVRIFNYSARFAPPGKTVVQVEFESAWKHWSELSRDRPRYKAEKERVAAEALARLESHYAGISSQVEMTDVATPYTAWRYTRNHEGAYMGWSPTPKVIMTSIPRTLPGLEDFYMAGQWVMPGGSVPSCLYSGQHVVQILCQRDGKRFVTSVP
jgi:phytoene desaturase